MQLLLIRGDKQYNIYGNKTITSQTHDTSILVVLVAVAIVVLLVV